MDIEKWERNKPEISNEYFENMQISVLNKIEKSKKKTIFFAINTRNVYWIAAACVAFVIAFVGFSNREKSETKEQQTFATINQEILDKSIENENIVQNTIVKTEPQEDFKTPIEENPIVSKKIDDKKNRIEARKTKEEEINEDFDDIFKSYSDEEIEILKNEFDDNLFSITE